ncbi:hypothetical protein EDD18DRAFT_1112331 [Armillaria luteobubalina]|uniref:Uncharacterized protein n=1 Tax=Armillaria luteobubalina TaxID=153913 RepID=A0AA39UBE5_9AGAR|nr:hypothetical protein EDD18DRAFT_1112331 [Armillaria luteobubalina]
MTKIANSERTEPRGSSSPINFYYVTLEHKSGVFIIELPGETRVLGAVARCVGELFLVTGYGGSSSENIPVNLVKISLSFLSLRPSSTASIVSLLALFFLLSSPTSQTTSSPLVSVRTLAKIKAKHILEHLRMASSEQLAVPPQTDDTSTSTTTSGPSKPTAFQQSLARRKFYTGLDSLASLQAAPPQPHWTSARVDKWVHEAKKLWAHCGTQVETANISAKEFRGVEFEFLQLLVDFPDEWIEGAAMEYNDFLQQQYKICIFPLPLPETSVVETTPTPRVTPQNTIAPPSSVLASSAPIPPQTVPASKIADSSVVTSSQPMMIPPKAPSIDRSTSSQGAAPPKVPSDTSVAGPQHPKLTLRGPRPPVTAQGTIFSLDPTSPLHPAATKVDALPPSSIPLPGVRRLQGQTSDHQFVPPAQSVSSPRPTSPIQTITPASPASLDLGPLQAGTDDEDEPPTPRANDKGKDKEIIPGTNEEEGDFQGQFDSFETMDVDQAMLNWYLNDPKMAPHLTSYSQNTAAPEMSKWGLML